jgi:cell wall-associated NlpC family hydrolase
MNDESAKLIPPSAITRADVVRAALALVGTPFRHQHSDPATGGLDCRGLIEYLAHRLYGRPIPTRDYRRFPDGREFYEQLAAEMDEVAPADALPGDVPLIKLPRQTEARHAGVIAPGPFEPLLVHAWERDAPGRVVAEPYRGWPARRTVTAFRFRGLVD